MSLLLALTLAATPYEACKQTWDSCLERVEDMPCRDHRRAICTSTFLACTAASDEEAARYRADRVHAERRLERCMDPFLDARWH